MRGWGVTVVAALALAACGGGGGGADAGGTESAQSVATDLPASREDAARFLTQASFGPSDADVDTLMRVGYSGWIAAQFAKPARSHQLDWQAADAALKAADPKAAAGQREVLDSFWKQALTGEDQLRQRVAFALSQIMVISMMDANVGGDPRGVANYLDMLGDKGLGNYRDLLQGVALHPMMGLYLSSIRNQKADARTGRVPDENFAREVMQLFSIGLHQLNADGSEKLGANGQPIDTYGPADIGSMARVFTGWSWACTKGDAGCFYGGKAGDGSSDPDRDVKPMQAYPAYHSTESKSFLGTTLASGSADPAADLKSALDALFAHPNVGPFIGRQLIQRLVTSNPSPAYVAAVAAAFADNGAGVRGDMRAVVRAVLLHPEARASSSTQGKLREPVLKLSALLRAFPLRSVTGRYSLDPTDDAATQLAQTPLRSPSVFNFYRPGYVAPNTAAAAAGLVAPELQIANESSAAGYVNYMRNGIQNGFGVYDGTSKQNDLQPDHAAELALADQTAALVDRLDAKLTYGRMPAALKSEIQSAVEKIAIPALNKAGSNQAAIDAAKLNRVRAALLLAVASPEFQVQQ